MNTKILSVCFLLIILALAAACGGGAPFDGVLVSAQTGGTVTSDDGSLSLEIPPGAISEDTTISITLTALDDLPDDLRDAPGADLGYRLEPDGLIFSQPVTVSLAIDSQELFTEDDEGVTVSTYLLFTLNEAGEVEALEDLELAVSLEEASGVLRAKLSHFSWITRTKGSMHVQLEKLARMHWVNAGLSGWVIVSLADHVTKSNGVEVTHIIPTGFGKVSAIKDALDPYISGLEVRLVKGGKETLLHSGNYLCASTPGLGTYGIQVKGFNLFFPKGDPNKVVKTPLRVSLDGVVECIIPPTATSTPTPTATPTPTPTPTSSAFMPVSDTQELRISWTNGKGNCGMESSFSLRGTVEIVGSAVTLSIPFEASVSIGVIEPNGDFFLESVDGYETWKGNFSPDWFGMAVNVYTDEFNCITTWDVTFTPNEN
ncbi:MAG: hypothetical protein IH859_00825 [Chloroflexi bacterium]|nr:hypothetical protein [Chloroflexota bacterium]